VKSMKITLEIILIYTGWNKSFSHYTEALDMILSPECPDDEDLEDEKFLEIY